MDTPKKPAAKKAPAKKPVAKKPPAKRGRKPAVYDPHIGAQIEKLAAIRMGIDKIAPRVGVSTSVIRKLYMGDVENGRLTFGELCLKSLFDLAMKGNGTARINAMASLWGGQEGEWGLDFSNVRKQVNVEQNVTHGQASEEIRELREAKIEEANAKMAKYIKKAG